MGNEALTARDIREFAEYLHNCTDAQVRGVYVKELEAGREAYATLAKFEAWHRGLDLRGD